MTLRPVSGLAVALRWACSAVDDASRELPPAEWAEFSLILRQRLDMLDQAGKRTAA